MVGHFRPTGDVVWGVCLYCFYKIFFHVHVIEDVR